MNVLDIDIDVFYPPYNGSIYEVDRIDKSKDALDMETLQAVGDVVSEKVNGAKIHIFEDHDEVYHLLKQLEVTNGTLCHLDAHTDRIHPPQAFPYYQQPTLANWVTFAIADNLVSSVLSLNNSKPNRAVHTSYEVWKGYEATIVEASLREAPGQALLKETSDFDMVCFTKSRQWCNYSDEDFAKILTAIKGEKE